MRLAIPSELFAIIDGDDSEKVSIGDREEKHVLKELNKWFMSLNRLQRKVLSTSGLSYSKINKFEELAGDYGLDVWVVILAYVKKLIAFENMLVTKRVEKRLARWTETVPGELFAEIQYWLEFESVSKARRPDGHCQAFL